MSPSELATLLVFCTAMSFSPGPNTTLSTALAANHGLRRALRFCLAVPTGWTLLMLASGLGLGALVLGVPVLRWGVKAAGVAYMLWLAWRADAAWFARHVQAFSFVDSPLTQWLCRYGRGILIGLALIVLFPELALWLPRVL